MTISISRLVVAQPGHQPVARRCLLAGFPRGQVDLPGGRRGACYLPDPEREYLQTGDSPNDYEGGPRTAKASEVALARLLNRFAQRPYEEFDRYFERPASWRYPTMRRAVRGSGSWSEPGRWR